MFLRRVVRYLAGKAGMRQFLDIGTGLPAANNADIRNPEGILETAALMLMGIMGHFTDDEAYPIVGRLQAGLPSGSYFALYDGASTNEPFNQAQQGYNDSGAVPYHLRSRYEGHHSPKPAWGGSSLMPEF